MKRILSFAIAVTTVLSVVSMPHVFAKENGETKPAKVSEVEKESRGKSDAAHLKACAKREQTLKHRLTNMSERGQAQLDVFKNIADNTKSFYAKKGYDAPGYAALATEVDTLYDQASVAVKSTVASADAWSCAGDSPKDKLNEFKETKKSEIAVLKSYRDKVRELILLVKNQSKSTDGSKEAEQ